MKSTEFIVERTPTDAELKVKGWRDPRNGVDRPFTDDEEDYRNMRWGSTSKIKSARSPVGFTCYEAIRDILGDMVTDDEDSHQPGMIYVSQGWNDARNSGIFDAGSEDRDEGAAIYLRDPQSHEAYDIAGAVHEAFHALMFIKSHGQLYTNEKMVNKMATDWLKKHLSGIELHTALECILKSKISYGHN